MSQSFFDELEISPPTTTSGSVRARTTSRLAGMLVGLEEVLLKESPDLVIVRGDTNSTLAGALAAAKAAHPDGAHRSRRAELRPAHARGNQSPGGRHAGRCALLCQPRRRPSPGRRGHPRQRPLGRDVMLDTLLNFVPLCPGTSGCWTAWGCTPSGYALVTIHRAANTDDPIRLGRIVEALNRVPETLIFPLHPRTRLALDHLGLNLGAPTSVRSTRWATSTCWSWKRTPA